MSDCRTRPGLLGALAVAASLVVPFGPATAQSYQQAPYRDEAFRPLRQARKGPAPPKVAVAVRDRLPLPAGPSEARLARDGDGALVLRLADGWRRVRIGSPDPVRRLEDAPPEAAALDPRAAVRGGRKGKLRFRIDAEGRLVAERRRGPRDAPRHPRKWVLRVPGTPAGPPTTIGGQVFVGSTDARVYAVRARNGNRLWARDLEARISRPLASWRGPLARTGAAEPEGDPFDLLLVVPDDGARLAVLDPFDGSVLGEYRPEGADDRIATNAVPLPDGGIAVVRAGYRRDDVELLVLDVAAVVAESAPAASGPDDDPAPRSPGGDDGVSGRR